LEFTTRCPRDRGAVSRAVALQRVDDGIFEPFDGDQQMLGPALSHLALGPEQAEDLLLQRKRLPFTVHRPTAATSSPPM